METTLFLPTGFLVAGILLQLALGKILTPKQKGWLAFVASLAALVSVLFQLPGIMHGATVQSAVFLWDQNVPLQYRLDGLSLVFALMATGIGSAILFYCIDYMAHEPSGVTRFYMFILTFIAGLVNLVYSANLLLVYLSWEVIGLCSYFLVGFWYKETAAANGARKVLIMTHLPGYGLLAAILLLYHQTGTFLWTDPSIHTAFTTGIFLLMLVAAMAKSVIFPLHTWIPEAMNAPTPVSALLHSACYVKAGVYLIARMYSLGVWPHAWNVVVLALGCATMLVGALFALTQTDLKRLLAFSTISQLGYIITGLGLGTNLGLAAGLFYCLSHGLFKGTLFLCAGAVQHSTGTRDMRRLGGLAKRMPNTARIWLVAACAIVGVPLTNGFVAKWLLLDAALEANQAVVVVIAWLVSVFTAFYMLKATVSTFYGETPAWLQDRPVHDADPSMLAGMGVLGALCVLFGLAPQLLMQSVVAPAVTSLGFQWEVALSWLGVQTTSAGIQVTLGAGIVVLAALIGALVFAATRSQSKGTGTAAFSTPAGIPAAAAPAAAGSMAAITMTTAHPAGATHLAGAAQQLTTRSVGVFGGGDPLPAQAGVTVDDFAALAEISFTPIYRVTDPDRVYMPLWQGINRLAGQVNRLLSPVCDRYPLLATLILAVVVCVAVWLW